MTDCCLDLIQLSVWSCGDSPHTLLPLLLASLSLVRRLQVHLRQSTSPYARIFASFPSTTTMTLPSTYIAAFCDRSRAPETESWIFTYFEVAAALTPVDEAACINLVLALSQTIVTISQMPSTRYPATNVDSYHDRSRRGHRRPRSHTPNLRQRACTRARGTFPAWGSEETFSAVAQVPDAPPHLCPY
jgi:hypothetical protein